jgi:putative N6-adenine-specific DNA methylase
MNQKVFATCTPGLEGVLAGEISALGYTPHPGKGVVETTVSSLRDAMVLNLHLRTASRVLWHLFDIERPTKQRIYHALSSVDWRPWFTKMPTMAVDVPFVAHHEFTNTLYAAQLAKDAICDMLRKATGQRPSVDPRSPQIQFSFIIDEQKASFSFDTSLEPLFKRGYRPEGVEAPLKETLAAALLMLAEYTPQAILLDPCCGGGTFLIEAGLIATNTAPGLLRKTFGFTGHPDYQREEWEEIRKQAASAITEFPRGRLFGCEKEGRSYRLLLRGIARAGLMDAIEVHNCDFRDARLPARPNFVITNPPFGVRLGEARRWVPLYKALGDLMKRDTAKPATGAVLTASAELAKEVGLRPKRKVPITHGGLDCTFCIYDLYAFDPKEPRTGSGAV